MDNTKRGSHVWSFSTIGGVKRVNLESGSDLVHLHELDPKLWTALSCPASDLEIDRKTLELIDTDSDGQIRVPEILGAIDWIVSVINNPDDLLKQASEFPLSAINTHTEQGRQLLDSARTILKNLGKESATSLFVEDTSDTTRIFAGTLFNGDGIITEDTVGGNEELSMLLAEVMVYAGSAVDRNGKAGVTQEIVQLFFDECEKYAAWYAKQEAAPEVILPLDDSTDAAYSNYLQVKAKIDDFFLRCRLAAFDHQSTETLNLQVARVESIADKDLSDCISEIAGYPIAKVRANGSLPLATGINPAWEAHIAVFKRLVTDRLFSGKDSITEEEWIKVSQTFAAFAQWKSEKEGASVELLGLTRIREILAGSMKDQLTALIASDMAVESEANNIILVDKLVRYHRDLFTLLKNFVTFFDFYTPGGKAVFQAGTLYIDQRSCDLCIRVRDMARQGALAQYGGMYLIYCECTSKATNEKMTIVAALTNGDVDDLVIGRNAIFYDRQGLDWDATIVKIMENPTSIKQAFFAPYRKLSNLIETQVHKAASAANEKIAAKMNENVVAASAKGEELKTTNDVSQAPPPPPPPPPPFDVAKFAGIFAAIGLAIGALGTVLAAAIGGFMKLTWWKMPLVIMGILLIISAPSMILAYLKLRKRNLAPILDANGWAINARVKINIQFGRTLTQLAALPKDAKVNLNDPFTKKSFPIIPALLILLIIVGGILYLLQKQGLIHIHMPM
ncbi:hypothetical protein CJD36_019045 [Flavipsychrobacter stenotrophus]|uniref:EF-hand domain-containing protein n=1 Tax=Flavipsychrobacter stenotrophus TaxID=2077091 RepID=A0A2S7SRV8_9BACT|nr:hypothetical protein [Flavipsychrobacter stenotrophus]PQJ09347.1 hypothetical protein CJD36_019045 [Flavipsychrobacter stenotrophus]